VSVYFIVLSCKLALILLDVIYIFPRRCAEQKYEVHIRGDYFLATYYIHVLASRRYRQYHQVNAIDFSC
jgi:hypothetical protein